jgi:hypothetical protein
MWRKFVLFCFLLSTFTEAFFHPKALGMCNNEVTATGCCQTPAARSGLSAKQIMWQTHFCLIVRNACHTLDWPLWQCNVASSTVAHTAGMSNRVCFGTGGGIRKGMNCIIGIRQVGSSYRRCGLYERLLRTYSSKCRKPTSPHVAAPFCFTIRFVWQSGLTEWTACLSWVPVFRVAQQPRLGLGRLLLEVSRSHTDTPHSVGLLWTSDQPDAETSIWQHTTLTRDGHTCPRRESNTQSQQANGHRPTP